MRFRFFIICAYFFIVFIVFPDYAQGDDGVYGEDDYIEECMQSRALGVPDVPACQCVLRIHKASQKNHGNANFLLQKKEQYKKRMADIEGFFIASEALDESEFLSLCNFANEALVEKAEIQRIFDQNPGYSRTAEGKADIARMTEIDKNIREHYQQNLGLELARRKNPVFGVAQRAMQYCEYQREIFTLSLEYDKIKLGVPRFSQADFNLRKQFRQCVH